MVKVKLSYQVLYLGSSNEYNCPVSICIPGNDSYVAEDDQVSQCEWRCMYQTTNASDQTTGDLRSIAAANAFISYPGGKRTALVWMECGEEWEGRGERECMDFVNCVCALCSGKRMWV